MKRKSKKTRTTLASVIRSEPDRIEKLKSAAFGPGTPRLVVLAHGYLTGPELMDFVTRNGCPPSLLEPLAKELQYRIFVEFIKVLKERGSDTFRRLADFLDSDLKDPADPLRTIILSEAALYPGVARTVQQWGKLVGYHGEQSTLGRILKDCGVPIQKSRKGRPRTAP